MVSSDAVLEPVALAIHDAGGDVLVEEEEHRHLLVQMNKEEKKDMKMVMKMMKMKMQKRGPTMMATATHHGSWDDGCNSRPHWQAPEVDQPRSSCGGGEVLGHREGGQNNAVSR
jgi:hypothetical protein